MSQPSPESDDSMPIPTRPTLVKSGLPDFSLQWKDLRRRKKAFFIAWLAGWIPAYGIAAILYLIFKPTGDWGFLTFILWMIAFYKTGFHWYRFRCPRCEKRFFSRGIYSNNFSRKCLHCGLKIAEMRTGGALNSQAQVAPKATLQHPFDSPNNA